jgi:hypothetical protein
MMRVDLFAGGFLMASLAIIQKLRAMSQSSQLIRNKISAKECKGTIRAVPVACLGAFTISYFLNSHLTHEGVFINVMRRLQFNLRKVPGAISVTY